MFPFHAAAAQALEPIPGALVAESTTQSGPFRFYLAIYKNPSLRRKPIAPSLYSDVTGFGTYMYWRYDGGALSGLVEEYWGTEPGLNLLKTYTGLEPGQVDGRSGGILLRPPGKEAFGEQEPPAHVP